MPNFLEEPERGNMAFLMCSAFQLAIAKGWRPTDKKKTAAAEKKKRMVDNIDLNLSSKFFKTSFIVNLNDNGSFR